MHHVTADAGSDLPPSSAHTPTQAIGTLFAHLDGVIDQASQTHRLALDMADDRASGALDDAISLLHHVRSRLRYDLGPTA